MSVLLARLMQGQRRRTDLTARRSRTMMEWPLLAGGGASEVMPRLFDVYNISSNGSTVTFKVFGGAGSGWGFQGDGAPYTPDGLDEAISMNSGTLKLVVFAAENTFSAQITPYYDTPSTDGSYIRYPLWYVNGSGTLKWKPGDAGSPMFIDLRGAPQEERM